MVCARRSSVGATCSVLIRRPATWRDDDDGDGNDRGGDDGDARVSALNQGKYLELKESAGIACLVSGGSGLSRAGGMPGRDRRANALDRSQLLLTRARCGAIKAKGRGYH